MLGVAQRRLTGPDPHEAGVLAHWPAPNGGEGLYPLPGHGRDSAVAPDLEPVVAANQPALHQTAQRQRRATRGAPVFERGGAAVGVAEGQLDFDQLNDVIGTPELPAQGRRYG